MPFTSHQERYSHLQHLRDSIDRLLIASKDWKPADAARGEATIQHLERQIELTRAEMMASR